jgi:serine/threonine protein kinase
MSFENAVSIANKKSLIKNNLHMQINFTAPEVYLGKHDCKVDEYAAGVLMYYLLSENKYPFKLDSGLSNYEMFW